mgnify:CR=1 FL=1
MKRKSVKKPVGERLFETVNVVFLSALAITMLLPLLNIAATSFSSAQAAESKWVYFWPVNFTLESWRHILSRQDLWRSTGVSVFVTVTGVVLSLFFTAMTAYPLSRKYFYPRKAIMVGIVITMIFRAPLIPYFITVKALGLYNNIWVLIIPSLISAFDLIIMRTFFMQIPDELEEAAKIEGCNDFQILYKIILPLSKPIIATLGLFAVVLFWNIFQHAIWFIRNNSLYPLQLKLRAFIVSEEVLVTQGGKILDRNFNSTTLLSAAIIFASLPVLSLFPVLQKYFVKGTLLGSIKQ